MSGYVSFHHKKHLGQNFLHDVNILKKIVDLAHLSSEDIVVEIGPGDGALTQYLIPRVSKLLAIEVDPRLIPRLNERFQGNENFELDHQNALDVDFTKRLDSLGKRVKVVANLPYSIATPLLFHLLSHRRVFNEFLLMLPTDLVERIASAPGGRTYGILSVMMQNYTQIFPELPVPACSFWPRPKISSVVTRFTLLPNARYVPDDETAFRRVVQAAFSKRRKMLHNALASGLSDVSSHLVEEMCTSAGILSSRRAETLSLEEFGRLTMAYRQMINNGL